jgi:hypothetical protein
VTRLDATYVLPLRWRAPEPLGDITSYLRQVAEVVAEVIVADGSPPDIFARHRDAWSVIPGVVHVPPDADLRFLMGKVNGVMTGVRRASSDRVVIADDDVRYEDEALARLVRLLDHADVVRPQNYFDPLPWHARWDTARSLLNRVMSRDWPGTLAVRRSVLLGAGGYDGDVMFENLELVRTVVAAGGVEAAPLDLYVRRTPPSSAHFWSQRVRQAYDELARPGRLVCFLAVVPVSVGLVATGRRRAVVAAAAVSVAVAEAGRRRAGGTAVFPPDTSLFAPLWIGERAITSWLALWQRVRHGGVRYGDTVIPRAATPKRELYARVSQAGSNWRTNMSMRSASSTSPISPATRPSPASAERNPRFVGSDQRT